MVVRRTSQLVLALYVLISFATAYSAFGSFSHFNLLEARRGGGHSSGGGGSSSGGGESSGSSSSGSDSSGSSGGGAVSSGDTGTSSGGSDAGTSSGTSSGTGSTVGGNSDCNPFSVTGSNNVTGGSTDCVGEFGAGYAPCFGLCYNKGAGEVCCAANYKCDAGEYCGYGTSAYCCATYLTPLQCSANYDIPQPPSSFQPGDADATGTATMYASPVSTARSSCSATSSPTSGAVSGGGGSNTVSGGAVSGAVDLQKPGLVFVAAAGLARLALLV